jgi:hypothetical protein
MPSTGEVAVDPAPGVGVRLGAGVRVGAGTDVSVGRGGRVAAWAVLGDAEGATVAGLDGAGGVPQAASTSAIARRVVHRGFIVRPFLQIVFV